MAQGRFTRLAAGSPAAMGFDVTQVQKALKGQDYPASPDDLASTARGNDAPGELVEELRKMEKERFDGPNAVMSELKGSLGRD